MPIQKKTGYEPPENAYTGPGGPFIVTLVNITEPREVESTYDGVTSKRMVEEWQFALEDGQMVWDPWVTSFNGDSLSDRAKMYEYAAALVGGTDVLEQRVFPNVTDLTDMRAKLIGRQAIANLSHPADGPVKIDSLSAIPEAMLKPAAVQTASVTQPVAQPVQAQPLRQQVDADLSGNLPF